MEYINDIIISSIQLYYYVTFICHFFIYTSQVFTKMDASSFYGTRKTNLQAVFPSYAEDSDDGIDSDDDVANPDYTPNTTDATECDVEERDDEYIDSSTMMDSNEGSSNQQLEGPSKMRKQNIVVIEPNDEPSEDNTSREHQWRKRDIDNIYPEEIEFTRPDDVLTPYQYFSQFFTPEMISLITYNTNLFSVQEHSKGAFRLCNFVSNFLVAREKLLRKLQARKIFRTRRGWIFIAWIFIARNFIAQ